MGRHLNRLKLNSFGTGFLLTGHSFDHSYNESDSGTLNDFIKATNGQSEKGKNGYSYGQSLTADSTIELWLTTDHGPVKLIISGETPLFFIARIDSACVKKLLSRKRLGTSFNTRYLVKGVPMKNFQQDAISSVYFTSIKAFYEARRLLEKEGIEFYEGQFRLEERYLMERFVYGSLSFKGEPTQKNGFIEYKNVKIKASDYTPDLRVISFDLECSESGDLFSAAFYAIAGNCEPGTCEPASKTKVINQVVMVGPRPEAPIDLPEDPLSSGVIDIQWVADEYELLSAFQVIIARLDPDVIIGWNVINFDFQLLHRRAAFYGMKLVLGRNGGEMRWRDNRVEKNQGFVSLDGRVVIDGIAALKAESYSFPSFSLEAISQHFLGRGKATEDVDQRLATILHDFENNKPKLAYYNLQDCILVWDIFKQAKLLDYLVFRSQLTGLALDRTGGSVAAFTNLYLPQLHRQGYVSPNLPLNGGLASPGGYVMDSKPGLYKNVLVFDFKSLYPAIIRTFKIDPLGLVEGCIDPDTAIQGFKGALFSRDKHLLPTIISELWMQRDIAKKNNDLARSQAIKIIMNSFYGVLGSGGCAFYDTKLASSITLRGHQIMKQTAQWIEERGYSVIYGDTDSTFVLLDQATSPAKAVEIGKELADFINRKWQDKLTKDFQLDCFLEIEFETYFSRFLMPTIRGSEKGSKKRYAGLVKRSGNNELVPEKLIFKGLESVRTDWTELAREFQRELYKMLFSDRDPAQFILETVRNTLAGKNDAQLVYRKRLRRTLTSYVKNIPPHVKAARLADAENLKRKKTLKYQYKGWISYLVTANGPQPIEYISAAIDYQHYVEKQIQPVADGILPFVGLSFTQIVDKQLGLF